jgi:hypothetical protein
MGGDHRHNGKNGGFSPPCIWRTRNFTNGEGATDGGDQENGLRSGRRRGSAPRGDGAPVAGADRASKSGIGARSTAGGGEGPFPSPSLSLPLGGRARARLRCCCSCFGRRGGGRSGRVVTQVWQFDNWEAWPRGFRSTKLTGPTRQEHVVFEFRTLGQGKRTKSLILFSLHAKQG